MDIKEVMENLKNEMWGKINENDFTLTQFAIRCDMSYGNLRRILNGDSKDISASMLLNICENADIKIEKIFDIPDFDFKKIEFIVKYDGKTIKSFTPPPIGLESKKGNNPLFTSCVYSLQYLL